MVGPGHVLNGRFTLEALIGEGGMGSVYRATQLATGRAVAIKLLRQELGANENLVARFRREGLVMCKLANAHTVTLFDFDQTRDGIWYLAMELLHGKSLHSVLAVQPRLPWQRTFTILRAVCASLAEAHGHGIVHRDLKPENIYLEPVAGDPEFVKVLDFGIATKVDLAPLTALGQMVGTPDYMSPEQLRGPKLDHRSDIYALGVIAYLVITGQRPYPTAVGPVQLMSAQMEPPPPPSSLIALPAGVDRVIMRCLAELPEDRFASVDELAAALELALAAPAPAAAAPVPAAATPRRSWLVIAGVAVACIAAGIAIFALS